MIRIDKPADGPEILTTTGARRRAQDIEAVAAGREIEFDRSIYAAREVVDALYRAQHRKCCYCERLLDRRERDVEHFRPKAEVRQGHEHASELPGYFWLAYEWSNLYLACRPCNQEYKGALFPLLDPSARMRGPDGENLERPLLIDPGHEDPEEHIDFDEAEVCRREGSLRGEHTIRTLELGRPELNHARRHYFGLYATAILTLRTVSRALPREQLVALCSVIAEACHASAPFAGMMRAYLRRQLGPALACPPSTDDLLAYVAGG